jgi:shikimate kinase
VREENRQALRHGGHKVIYLRCDPLELLRRVQLDPTTTTSRPNLTPLGGGLSEIESVLASREPIYRQAMHAELDVTDLSPDDAVACIVNLL